jgi:hypothetical protein
MLAKGFRKLTSGADLVNSLTGDSQLLAKEGRQLFIAAAAATALPHHSGTIFCHIVTSSDQEAAKRSCKEDTTASS